MHQWDLRDMGVLGGIRVERQGRCLHPRTVPGSLGRRTHTLVWRGGISLELALLWARDRFLLTNQPRSAERAIIALQPHDVAPG